MQVIHSIGVRRVIHGQIRFAAGAYHAVGVRLLDRGRQIAPVPSGWITGNNEVVSWSEDRRLEGPPFEITIEAYSIAEDWPHVVEIQLEVIPR